MSVPVFEFNVAGRDWQSKRLDPFVQGFMLKRVAPLVGPMVPLIVAATQDKLTAESALGALEKHFPAFAESIGSLKDDDLQWLMETSMGTLKIKDENANGAFMPFWNKAARNTTYTDLYDLAVMLPLTIRVIKENLTPFFVTTVTGRKDQTNQTTE